MDRPLKPQADGFLFTRWWWGEAVLVILLGAIFVTAFLSDPSQESISLFGVQVPELCVVKRLTGYRCPGCGLTRSFAYMGEGQVLEAFRMHILGPPIFVAMLYQLVYSALRLFKGPRWIAPWKRWWRSLRARR